MSSTRRGNIAFPQLHLVHDLREIDHHSAWFVDVHRHRDQSLCPLLVRFALVQTRIMFDELHVVQLGARHRRRRADEGGRCVSV